MQVQDLVGSWSLLGFEIEDPRGSVAPWGRNTTGLLIYSSDGRMSASINADPEGDRGSASR